MLGVKRLVRHAVASNVDRHQAELICQEVAVELVCPTEMVLRPTVNKEDSRSLRIAPFPYVELETAASFNRVSLHLSSLYFRFPRILSTRSSVSENFSSETVRKGVGATL